MKELIRRNALWPRHIENAFLKTDDLIDILDALEEWLEVVEPKELNENEAGLNFERYVTLVKRIKILITYSIEMEGK